MNDGVGTISGSMPVNGAQLSSDIERVRDKSAQSNVEGQDRAAITEVTLEELTSASVSVEELVNEVADTSLTFSVESELSRMVVAVRAVGSDEIIRQFPPEEFITVAKFIAAQRPEDMNDDFLKGILFDQYT